MDSFRILGKVGEKGKNVGKETACRHELARYTMETRGGSFLVYCRICRDSIQQVYNRSTNISLAVST